MPRGYKNSPSGLPTGPGTLYEACDGDEVKVRTIQRLTEKVGIENLDWLADQMDWAESVKGQVTEGELWAEIRRRMPAEVRVSVVAHLDDYYRRHPEEDPRS